MRVALKSFGIAVILLALAAVSAEAAIEVSAVDGEASYPAAPKVDSERQTMQFGEKEYKWTDLIEMKLQPLQKEPSKGYKIFFRNGNVIYGEILGAEIKGASVFLRIKSAFLGAEAATVNTDSITGVQNLNDNVYLKLVLAALQRKAQAGTFGRVEFNGTQMTVQELQDLFDKEPARFAADAEKMLANTSNSFQRYINDEKRWEYDFFYGVASGETEAYGLINKIDDQLNIELVRDKTNKVVTGNLKDIVGLSFKVANRPAGFGDNPYVRILGVRGETVTGQILSEKDGVMEVKTDLEGVSFRMPFEEIAEMVFFNGSFIFLSDLAPSASVEYGDICLPGTTKSESFPWQRDRSTMQKRPPMKLSGKIYRKGIGVHSYSALTFDIGGNYKRFQALAGIDDDVPKPGNVTVEIYGDDRELLQKTTVKSGDKPFAIDVDVTGVKSLKIVVDFGEDGYHNDHCDMANAILIE